MGLASAAQLLSEPRDQLRALPEEVIELRLDQRAQLLTDQVAIGPGCCEHLVWDEVTLQSVLDLSRLGGCLDPSFQVLDRVESPNCAIGLPGDQGAVQSKRGWDTRIREQLVREEIPPSKPVHDMRAL